jgi:hypothetical protein
MWLKNSGLPVWHFEKVAPGKKLYALTSSRMNASAAAVARLKTALF